MSRSAAPLIAPEPVALRGAAWADYALIDSGDGKKLERYGGYTVVRPEPQCLWSPLRPAEWAEADAVFEAAGDEESGRWRLARPVPESWPMTWRRIGFEARLTAFRHLAVFPEHAANWEWIEARLARSTPAVKVLNLFGYSGIASLVAAAAGASVTHVDASRKAVAWARRNAALSGLADRPIRWICEDARKYVAREARRGARYHAIILDPPKYGRGPAGEIWRLYEHLPELVAVCVALLDESASFLLINAYSERISGLALAGLVAGAAKERGGLIEWGELALMETAGARGVGLSFFARWISS
ncbi:MAG: class I SAM-dependent methyltransferase [Caulobacteraceae bacterium]